VSVRSVWHGESGMLRTGNSNKFNHVGFIPAIILESVLLFKINKFQKLFCLMSVKLNAAGPSKELSARLFACVAIRESIKILLWNCYKIEVPHC
jgi:hypothetical protein